MTEKTLIERLRAASGPDRELDALIHQAANPSLADMIPDIAGANGWLVGGDHPDPVKAPPYTSSLDAAVSLIPSGLYWHAGEGRTRPDEPLGGVEIFDPSVMEPAGEAEHESLIIAFCIAGLHARTRFGDGASRNSAEGE